MSKKIIVGTVIAALVFAIAYYIYISQKSDPRTFKVGAILSLTGRGAKYGKASQQGIEIALKEINNQGGVNGYPIEIIVEDSMSESKSAISAYKKLIDTHRVQAVIGPLLSDEVLAIAPEANRKKVLIIAPAAGSDEISNAGPYVFRNRESAMLQSVEIAQFLSKQPPPKRIAIICSMTANAISYKKAFIEALGDERKQIVLDESFSEGQQDFRTVIAKLNNVLATHVFVPGLAPEIARILMQAKETGIQVQWLATAGAFDPELLKIAGPAAEGLIFGTPTLETEDPVSPASKLNDSLSKAYGTEVDMFSANAYDALLMLTMAANKAKVSGKTIRDELEGVKDFPGAGGRTTFVNPGTVIKPISLKIVKKGKFVSLPQSL
jgi:branched-chain amino acid transport system substrate-binding protein